MNWNRLPELPLSLVLRHLGLRDKISVWNTCLDWRCAIERSDSWMKLEFSWRKFCPWWEDIFPKLYKFLADFDKCMSNCGSGIRGVEMHLCVADPNGYEVLETLSKYCSNVRTLSISIYAVDNTKPIDIMSDQHFAAVIKEFYVKSTN